MKISYSSEGEDILVLKLFERYFPRSRNGEDGLDVGQGGTYVDVGAYHPWRNSNTALLSELGWKGVCIDARPGSMEAFQQARPWDRHIECAVGADGLELFYHTFDRDELNCLGEEAAKKAIDRGAVPTGLPKPVTVRRLDELLIGVSAVDFLSVDVEGHELEVLRTLDWEEHRPAIICIEDCTWRPCLLEQFGRDPYSSEANYYSVLTAWLSLQGYWCHSRLHCSLIFVDSTRARVR